MNPIRGKTLMNTQLLHLVEAPTERLDQPTPCRREPDLWFAEAAADVERAKTLCRSCPLQAVCLEAALENAEPWGVWGGEVLLNGVIQATKRGRGRPRKNAA